MSNTALPGCMGKSLSVVRIGCVQNGDLFIFVVFLTAKVKCLCVGGF